jgi:hypothetical protein
MGTIVKLMHARRNEQAYRHPAWISRARSRMRNGQRGVALIEAAFVTPIFLLFIMAIAEAGLYMRNYLGVANTVRAGARTASAAGAFPTADLYLVNSMGKESAAIPRNLINYIVVYKATGFGAGPTDEGADGVPAGCLAGHPRPGQCNVYTPAHFDIAAAQIAEETRHAAAVEAGQTSTLDLSKIVFGCQSTGPHASRSPDRYWCPTDRNDTYRNADFVGIYMSIDHDWLTGIFGDSRVITDQSVIRIEPKRK